MFKLLIADDEQLERDALKYIISKSIDSIIDIEEAKNGREAISKVLVSKPDIVILDINMPGINGIEAAWKIREKNSDVIIVFLTAFHQFDYAHEAIKIGVDDYIIKPSSEKRIIEVMEKVTNKLTLKNREKRERENIELKLDKATDYLSSEFTYNLATRNMEKGKILNYLTLLDMNFYIGRGFIFKLDYESYPIKIDTDYQKYILKKRCIRVLINTLNISNIRYSINMDLNNMYLLLFSSEPNKELESNMDELSSEVSKTIKENINIKTLFGIGSLFTNVESALQSFSKAKTMLSGNSQKNLHDTKTFELPLELEMNFEQAILSVDKHNTEQLFYELEQLINLSNTSFEVKKRSCKELAVILKHAACVQFPKVDCNINVGDIKDAKSSQELITSFKFFLNEIIDLMQNLYNVENTPVIKRACEYIKNNFYKNINLETTADYCNLSTFYFSKVFKEEKDKNFINYLTEIRIDEAKKMLKEGNLTIKEITSAIGYNDPNYFTRVFKKLENVSPSDFRNKKMLKTQ